MEEKRRKAADKEEKYDEKTENGQGKERKE